MYQVLAGDAEVYAAIVAGVKRSLPGLTETNGTLFVPGGADEGSALNWMYQSTPSVSNRYPALSPPEMTPNLSGCGIEVRVGVGSKTGPFVGVGRGVRLGVGVAVTVGLMVAVAVGPGEGV